MVEVKLHDIGEGMTEGDIITYFVKEGEDVNEDQPIIEVQTEKMVTELTAPKRGKIKDILVEEGATISVGTTILTIDAENGSNEEDKASPKDISETPKSSEPVSGHDRKLEVKGPVRIKAAPYTRKIARELEVDIEQVQGTGKDGRITVEDVKDFKSPGEAADKGENVVTATKKAAESPMEDENWIPFKGRRKKIAKKMTQSIYTIPHVAHMEEVDMTELLAFRQELKPEVSISIAAFFIKTLAIALKDYPIFNSELDEENGRILLKDSVHMGIATDTPEGLIVPVIRNTEGKPLSDIHKEMKSLTAKAMENKLTGKEATGSTFTISNVGPLGSIGATPIINYPEVALMAFHKTKKMPVVDENDEIVIRSMMNITLTFDHRVADGGEAIAFTNRFKSLLENPKLLLLELV
ncbi:dihydrolipoamide acetyltransferase family protein [Salinicoccus bachuensis]|uniref:Dihydrolipoamide acetyltransferase component of pyruvate dehydrogenase complex n=1 Tax=Salinicoccus bachuensis TaxID=3136731 RepID=A0ABZ3CIV2_9STAP